MASGAARAVSTPPAITQKKKQGQASDFDVRTIERDLRTRLEDWRGLLQRHTPLSRQVADWRSE